MRLNNGQEVLARVEKVFKYTVPLTAITETTLTAEAEKGDTALAITSATGLAEDDSILLFGSEMEIAQLASATTTPGLELPLAFAHPNGTRLVKALLTDFGYIEEGGISLNGSYSVNAVQAANARGAIAYIDGDGAEMDASFGLRETNIENVLAAFGIDESTLSGTGTPTDPFVGVIGRDTIGTQANYAMRGTFRQVNGKPVWCDLLNCFAEVQVSAALGAKGTPAVWTVRARPTSIVIRRF